MSDKDEKLLRVDGLFLGKAKAERHVKYLSQKISLKIPEGKNYSEDVYYNLNGKKVRINFKEAIQETQKSGSPYSLQFLADSQD